MSLQGYLEGVTSYQFPLLRMLLYFRVIEESWENR